MQLVFLLPMLAVGSRRLHDRGVSGWWQLILLISCCLLIPQLVLIFAFWILPSKREPNKYGPVPGSAGDDSGTYPAGPAPQPWPAAPLAGPAHTQYGGPPTGGPYGNPPARPTPPPDQPPPPPGRTE